MKDNTIKEEEEENDFLDSVGIKATYYNDFVERYFTKYYFDKDKDTEQFLFIHSNGIIVCGFGRNHFITKEKINGVTDLKRPGKITGRRKHGAHFLNENEYVLQVSYGDGKTVNFCPKLKGKLLEINQSIVEKPILLNESPESFVFVCIIQLEQNGLESLKNKLDNDKMN